MHEQIKRMRGVTWPPSENSWKRRLLALAGTMPYLITQKGIQTLGRSVLPNSVLTSRNSFALGYLQPGWSDLDMSLELPKAYSTKSLKTFLWIYGNLQKFWPLLGELNIYDSARMSFIEKYHNPFELQRNPYLTRISEKPQIIGESHAAVFMLRQCEKDLKNLMSNPEARLKKWRFHWEKIHQQLDLGYAFDFPSESHLLFDGIVSMLLPLCGIKNPVHLHEMTEKINLFFELLICKSDLTKTRSLFLSEPWFIAWWPQIFVQWETNYVHLNRNQLEVFKRQIEWELCGIISHYSDSSEELSEHIERLHRLSAIVSQFSEDDQDPEWVARIFSEFPGCQWLDDRSGLA